MPAMVSAFNHGDNLVGIKAVACQHLRDLPSQRRFSTNDPKAGGMMGDPKTALEDRLQGVGERAMADIMKQPGDCEKVGVALGEVSFPGVEKRQPCDADTVVVAVVSVPGLHAVDRSQEAYPPEPLYWTGFDELSKKWILDQGRCVYQPSEWRKGFHMWEQRQPTATIEVRRQSPISHVLAHS